MLNRRRDRGRRVAAAARLAAVCAVVVAAFPFMAGSASAIHEPCPTLTLPPQGISTWDTKWPPSGVDGRGVTLCQATGSLQSKGWLTIANIEWGARVTIEGQRDYSYEPPNSSLTRFMKRTAEGWYLHLSPDDRLFSTTNASFFTDTNNLNQSSAMSLPWYWNAGLDSTEISYGKAYQGGDIAWDTPKRYLRFSNPMFGCSQACKVQRAQIGSFPTHYTINDIWNTFDEFSGWRYGTVGFTPTAGSGEARRNFVGVDGSKVYIFTSDEEYTLQDMEQIMLTINPNMTLIQLDGGGSAQMYSLYGETDSNIPINDREVPDVLAVYKRG